MNSKWKALGVVAVGALLLAGCSSDGGSTDGGSSDAGDSGSGEAEMTLRLGHVYGPESLENRAAERLAEDVSEASDGRIEIEVYPSGQLGSWEEMQEGLELGAVDIVIESLGSLERYTDLAAIEGVPFLYDDADQFFEVWDGPLGDEILQAIREDSGFLLTSAIYRGPRVLNSTKPIESLADAEGLKIRVPNQDTYIRTWQALGTAPTPLALTEVFSGLEQGAIEAQENPANVARFNSFFEVAPYIANTNHLYGNNHFQLWGDTFDSWDEETQQIFNDAFLEVREWSRQVALDEEAENLAFLEENGVTVTDVDRTEWAEATKDIVKDNDPQVQEWAEEIRG